MIRRIKERKNTSQKTEETRHIIDSSTHHLAALAACAPASYVPYGDNARAAVSQVEEKRGGEEDNVLGS
jgi:hypothetical protein